PFGITSGADGNLWVSERNGFDLARVTPGGSVTLVPVSNVIQGDLVAGADGNLWMAVNANLVRILPGGGVDPMSLPAPGPVTVNSLASGPDGDVWILKQDYPTSKVDRVTPDRTVTEFELPTKDFGQGQAALPHLLAANATGTLAFAVGMN